MADNFEVVVIRYMVSWAERFGDDAMRRKWRQKLADATATTSTR